MIRPLNPLLVLLPLLLGGCAAAMPGYTPPPLEGEKVKASPLTALKPMESGTLSSGGRYSPSAEEKALDCRKLTGSMQVILERFRDAPNRREPSAVASVMQKTTAPLFKQSTQGADIGAELAWEKARLVAYNELLAEKKCKTLDIEAELAKPKRAG